MKILLTVNQKSESTKTKIQFKHYFPFSFHLNSLPPYRDLSPSKLKGQQRLDYNLVSFSVLS